VRKRRESQRRESRRTAHPVPFGPLPDWALARIAQADTEALQQWALNVLQAERLEAVFGD